MEKEEKGLFYRLIDFWKEKVGLGETEKIGFPKDRKERRMPLAEMGTVAALAQEEVRQIFREEEYLPKEKKQEVDVFGVWQDKRMNLEEDRGAEEKPVGRTVFEERPAEDNGDRVFLWDIPVKEEKRRNILFAAEEAEKKKELPSEADDMKIEVQMREKRQAEQAVDIEQLMQKITKKLWEERESSGRRLR